ncbi:hypothetical protein DFH28DRAFT_1217781 [Melampsora americana]|nr:hypothetical protein DFH28DRAFT_1217781 [Melampsora americana]
MHNLDFVGNVTDRTSIPMSPRVLGTLDGTYHSPISPHDGFSHDTSSLLDNSSLFATSFHLQDDPQTLPGLQGGDKSPGFELAFQHGAPHSGLSHNPFYKPVFASSPLDPPSGFEFADPSCTTRWSEELLDTSELLDHSLDTSYGSRCLSDYSYSSDTSPPSSSSSSLLDFPNSFAINDAAAGKFPIAPVSDLIHATQRLDLSDFSPIPCLDSYPPQYSWSRDAPLWGIDRGCPLLTTNEIPFSSSASPMHHPQPVPQGAGLAPRMSENLFSHTEVFTSRCVQPGRLPGKPLRSKWSSRSRHHPYSNPDRHASSSPSTTSTDGSPIMMPHDRMQLLDHVVDLDHAPSKGRGEKLFCNFIPAGQTTPCGKGFDRGEHLKRHLLSHSGEKPFSCTLCGRNFSRNDNLKQHTKTHANANGRNSKLLRARRLHEKNLENIQSDHSADDIK